MKVLTYISNDGRELSGLDIMNLLESGELNRADAKRFKCIECSMPAIYRGSKRARPHIYVIHHDLCSFRTKFHYYDGGKERKIIITYDDCPLKLSGSFFDDEDSPKDNSRRSGGDSLNSSETNHESSQFQKFLLYLYLFSCGEYFDRGIYLSKGPMMFSDINYANQIDRIGFSSIIVGDFLFAEIASSREGDTYHFCRIKLSDGSNATVAIHKSKKINNPQIKAMGLDKSATVRTVLLEIGRIDAERKIAYAAARNEPKIRKYIDRIMGTNLIVREPKTLS